MNKKIRPKKRFIARVLAITRFIFLELYEFLEEENGSRVKGIYWNVNFPFPLSNRDVSTNVYSSLLNVGTQVTLAIIFNSPRACDTVTVCFFDSLVPKRITCLFLAINGQ